MAGNQFNSWTFVWTVLGFILILAGTSIDEWTSTIQTYRSVDVFQKDSPVVDISSLPDRGVPAYDYIFSGPTSYGTIAAEYRLDAGYDYEVICPPANQSDHPHHKKHGPKHPKEMGQRARQINQVSAGMIAMLLLSNTVSFIASFKTLLGATRASIGGDVASAKGWIIGAFITVVVTWALWLRAHQEYLDRKKNGCRFPGFEQVDVTLGGSFGLFIVASALYIIVLAQSTRAPAATTTNRSLVFFALAAFACVFVGSIYNVWSRASSNTFEQEVQKRADQVIQLAGLQFDNPSSEFDSEHFDETSKGSSIVSYEDHFGVYTAIEVLEISLTYSDVQNRAAICRSDVERDGANFAIVQGGRVTLGFAITATIFSFFAAWLQMNDNRNGFWLSVIALCCCAVSLIVWAVSADYVLRSRCCAANTCELSRSFGLVAAGAFMLVVAIFYQAWVLADDVYVLPAHAYGMANQLETEMQAAQ
jgi:hypothetical protein